MRRNNRHTVFKTIAAALIVLGVAVCVHGQFKAVRQLTSNNIIALAGDGDTLWIATERGFNYRTPAVTGNDLPGFEAGNLAYRFWCLGFGGGRAVAVINKDVIGDSIGFWQFNHAGDSQRQVYFRFPSDVYGDSARPAGSVVYSNGSFWTPFNYGGLARYDPAGNGVHVIRPGDAGESFPRNLAGLKDNEADTKAVLSLDVNRGDNSITVTAPKALWRYRPYQQNDKLWESIDTNPAFVDADREFVSFDAAFTVRKKVDAGENANVNTDEGSTLYSFITTRNKDGNDTALYAFDGASKRWRAAISNAGGYSVFPAVDGCMYALSENSVTVYADTAPAGQHEALSVLMPPEVFRDMLRRAGDDPNPTINDILFLPKTDSSGTLAVATETGLYVCDSAAPLSNRYGDFKRYRYVRDVGSNEAYALPGIIRGGGDGRYEKCVFVYKLKKDGAVTIRVYDYNMSLVRTVVKSERRSAGRSRSTDPARDVWDGTNNSGKRVWPGVYYFKITSNAGERRFGKVILAK